MNGYPVLPLRTALGSVIVKHSVKMAMKPKSAFRATPQMMACGRVVEASLTSSAAVVRIGHSGECMARTHPYALRSQILTLNPRKSISRS